MGLLHLSSKFSHYVIQLNTRWWSAVYVPLFMQSDQNIWLIWKYIEQKLSAACRCAGIMYNYQEP